VLHTIDRRRRDRRCSARCVAAAGTSRRKSVDCADAARARAPDPSRSDATAAADPSPSSRHSTTARPSLRPSPAPRERGRWAAAIVAPSAIVARAPRAPSLSTRCFDGLP
jgi:hypothetical protein